MQRVSIINSSLGKHDLLHTHLGHDISDEVSQEKLWNSPGVAVGVVAVIMFPSNMECDNWELGEFFDTHATSLFICASNSVPHLGIRVD